MKLVQGFLSSQDEWISKDDINILYKKKREDIHLPPNLVTKDVPIENEFDIHVYIYFNTHKYLFNRISF